jgi:hypothetical protein
MIITFYISIDQKRLLWDAISSWCQNVCKKRVTDSEFDKYLKANPSSEFYVEDSFEDITPKIEIETTNHNTFKELLTHLKGRFILKFRNRNSYSVKAK